MTARGAQRQTAGPAAVDLRLLSLPTVEVLAAGHDRAPQERRELVVMGITSDNGAMGWGECSALNRPTYTSEWARGSFAALTDLLSSAEPVPRSLAPAHPMAAAGFEMALTDLRLRGQGRSLAASLGSRRASVPAGAAVGLAPLDELTGRVATLVDAGLGRIKLKIEPGQDREPVEALRSRHPDLEIQVDGNGSYRPDDLSVLLGLVDYEVRVIEQPFPADDASHETIRASRALIDAGFALVGDEAVRDLEDARRLHALGMLSAISLKPARVGGLAAATKLHDWAVHEGIALTAGGMLECGLGRHALAAFASLDGFTIAGDLSPARRWLADDPWPDLHLTSRPFPARIDVPQGVGVAPPPDPDTLDRYTVERSTFGVHLDALYESAHGRRAGGG
ncbi:MAG: o-succinylbenzoate synthase [Actinomycetota bacterium]|nr:o-succinylbenzoate synthase [Actinomycetota bacterium]